MSICTRPCAALLTREPWRLDGEVPAYSWKLRKYVWVRFVGAQDGSLPACVRVNVISQAQIPYEHTAEEGAKGIRIWINTQPLDWRQNLREIKAANCNRICLTEVDIVVLQCISIVETARRYGMSINKRRIMDRDHALTRVSLVHWQRYLGCLT
jgi:hypothetical protein